MFRVGNMHFISTIFNFSYDFPINNRNQGAKMIAKLGCVWLASLLVSEAGCSCIFEFRSCDGCFPTRIALDYPSGPWDYTSGSSLYLSGTLGYLSDVHHYLSEGM